MNLQGFKQVPVSEYHLINDNGDIYSIRIGKLMLHQIKNECHSVTLNKKTFYIHRLVMMTFCPIDNYEEMYVNHKDKNRSNNHVSNLEWCTQKENLDWNKTNPRLSFLTYTAPVRDNSDLEGEEWTYIKGTQDYKISNFCRVKSLSRLIRMKDGRTKVTKEKILNPTKYSNGYLFVRLVTDELPSACMIHRLMALTFIDNPDNKPCVNHKDGVKTNNRIDNLEWVDKSENMLHALDILNSRGRGESNASNKYSEIQVRELFKYFKQGYSKVECGRKVGMTAGAAQSILSGKRWKYLNLKTA